MFMNKRGMISRIFIFIIAVFVAGLIAVLGTSLIGTIISNQQLVEFNRIETKFVQEFSEIAYGSSREINVRVPNSVTRICFYDPTEFPGKAGWDYESAFLKEMDSNIFFLGREKILHHMKINNINLQDKYVGCCNTGMGFAN